MGLIKPSENVIGADNQQERLDFSSWVVGFVDGEGTFSVSIINNKTTKFGKQIFPEFVVTQSSRSLFALEKIRNYFKCGGIVCNKRYDNHHQHLYRYCVRSIKDINEIIIPFFKKYQLQTDKKNDFKIFCRIIHLMVHKKHLSKEGFEKILNLAGMMNNKKKRI